MSLNELDNNTFVQTLLCSLQVRLKSGPTEEQPPVGVAAPHCIVAPHHVRERSSITSSGFPKFWTPPPALSRSNLMMQYLNEGDRKKCQILHRKYYSSLPVGRTNQLGIDPSIVHLGLDLSSSTTGSLSFSFYHRKMLLLSEIS